MDIHRCRFVPYPASPINALAFSHQSSVKGRSPKNLRLALGRANGDIELWDPKNGAWVQELVLKGGKGRSIEGLVWTHDVEDEGWNGKKEAGRLRLFSIGYSNAVTEWDISTGMPLRNCSGNYGEIWCIAAQPRWDERQDKQSSKQNQLLAVGCADGSIVLHSTGDGDLTYLRTLQRPSNLRARILSLTFNGRDALIAGCSDSTIWIYDIRGMGRVKNTMSLGAGPKGRSNDILVWTVKTIGQNHLVSGDSNGEVRFWDLRTATQLQRLKCHAADIHEIAPSADGLSLLSAGADRKLCKLQCSNESRRWHKVSHQRIHHSEVKAMGVFDTKSISVVVSGGGDSVPIVTPLRRFGAENQRSLSNLPTVPPLVSASKERIIVSWWDREISLCRVTADMLKQKSFHDGSNNKNSMDRILIQGEEAITSVSISPDGRSGLVVATSVGCKAFSVKRPKQSLPAPPASTKKGIKIRKMEVPQSLSRCGARHLQFSPDGRWLLVVRPDSQLLLYRFVLAGNSEGQSEILDNPIELHRGEHPLPTPPSPFEGTMGEYWKSVCRVAWSSDSRVLACSDLSGHLDAWILQGKERCPEGQDVEAKPSMNGTINGTRKDVDDESQSSGEEDSFLDDSHEVLGQFWSLSKPGLPKLSTFPLVLSFCPGSTPHRLVAITSLHEVYEFEVLRGSLSDWSRRNPPSHFPTEFLKDRDRVMGCIWDANNSKKRMWIYSTTALWMFDLSRDFPNPDCAVKARSQAPVASQEHPEASIVSTRKRKHDDEMSCQGAEDQQTVDTWARSMLLRSAGGRLAAPLIRHGLGNDIKTTTTDKMQESSEMYKIDLDEDGSFEGFSDGEDEVASRSHDVSSALAEYRRVRGAKEVRGDGRPDTARKASDEEDMSGGQRRMEGIDEDIQDRERQLRFADGKPSRASEKHAHFWRTYKYRPILGIVPLDKTGDEAMAGIEDDEVLPDIEVALVERPLWETDLDLPWESHP